jgi:uncharacterized membrane protein
MVFSRSVRTSIDIDAPAQRVWDLLLDWKAYPSWNPFLKSVEGEAKEGATIKIFAQPPGQSGMAFKPVLLKGQYMITAIACSATLLRGSG